jgi:mannitol/fructose-specific phosphotransferase system IIA component (Ntr-type)
MVWKSFGILKKFQGPWKGLDFSDKVLKITILKMLFQEPQTHHSKLFGWFSIELCHVKLVKILSLVSLISS